MKTTFTTINGTTFESNETGTYFYAMWTENGKQMKRRVKKAEFEAAQRENEIEQTTAEDIEITEEDIERDARELERLIAESEETDTTEAGKEIAELYCRHPEGTDLQKPAVFNQYGCVDCSKCNVQNCVHRNCMRRNPTSEGGLAECPRLKVKAEEPKAEAEQPKAKKERKPRKSKDIAHESNGVALTAKQVDFIKHLPDTYFWEDGLDSTIWVDCLCDDIQGQFAGKPMTVGAMISTLCEKGLGQRAAERKNGRKCTSFALTELGKRVAAELGLSVETQQRIKLGGPVNNVQGRLVE